MNTIQIALQSTSENSAVDASKPVKARLVSMFREAAKSKEKDFDSLACAVYIAGEHYVEMTEH